MVCNEMAMDRVELSEHVWENKNSLSKVIWEETFFLISFIKNLSINPHIGLILSSTK